MIFTCEGFKHEMEKVSFLHLLYELPLAWLGEGILAKKMMTHGTKVELGESKKGLPAKAIERAANFLFSKEKDPLRTLTKLPSASDLKNPKRWIPSMAAPITAPYSAGVRRGKILKQVKKAVPEETYVAIKNIMSMEDAKATEKGEKYFKQLGNDISKAFPKTKKPKILQNLVEDIASSDPIRRGNALKKVKNIRRGALASVGVATPLALVGAGFIGKTIYDKIRDIKKRQEDMDKHLINKYMTKGFSQEMSKVAWGLPNWLKGTKVPIGFSAEETAKLKDILAKNINVHIPKSTLTEASSQIEKGIHKGLDKALAKRFGFKGALTTGTAVAAGLALGSYITKKMTGGVEDKILGKLDEMTGNPRRDQDESFHRY